MNQSRIHRLLAQAGAIVVLGYMFALFFTDWIPPIGILPISVIACFYFYRTLRDVDYLKFISMNEAARRTDARGRMLMWMSGGFLAIALMIVLVSAAFDITDWNPAARSFLGWLLLFMIFMSLGLLAARLVMYFSVRTVMRRSR